MIVVPSRVTRSPRPLDLKLIGLVAIAVSGLLASMSISADNRDPVPNDGTAQSQGAVQVARTEYPSKTTAGNVYENRDPNRLSVLALAGPTSLRVHQGKIIGFQADLLRHFAAYIGKQISLDLVRHPQALRDRLKQQHYDLVVGAPANAAFVQRQGLAFATAFAESHVVSVTRRDAGKLADPAAYVGRRVAAMAASHAVDDLHRLSQQHPLLRWHAHTDHDAQALLDGVERNEIDVAFVDASTANALLDHHPQLKIQWRGERTYPIAWAFPSNSQSPLLASANDYLQTADQSGEIEWLHHRYFGSADALNTFDLRVFHKRMRDTLPVYRHMFIEAGHRMHLDWRLLAALSYQESLWDPEARSFTGVRGIMQLTQDTADRLRADPNNTHESVLAGARYLRELHDRLPDSITEPDRTWFALAAYNIGLGHVYDARALARKQGVNPDRWIQTRRFVGLLDSPKWYAQTKHGKARGDEAVRHVFRIRQFYNLIQGHEERSRTTYAKAADNYHPQLLNVEHSPSAWQKLLTLGLSVTAN